MWKETRCIFAPILAFQWNHYLEWPVFSDVGLNFSAGYSLESEGRFVNLFGNFSPLRGPALIGGADVSAANCISDLWGTQSSFHELAMKLWIQYPVWFDGKKWLPTRSKFSSLNRKLITKVIWRSIRIFCWLCPVWAWHQMWFHYSFLPDSDSGGIFIGYLLSWPFTILW